MVSHYKEEATQKRTNQQLFYYRNGVYQGKTNKINGKREGKGVIYLTYNHNFIASNEFINNELNGHCFFLYSHSKYQYGKWQRNKPHGVTVFRKEQILVITEFNQGTILQNSKSMIVFEKYNLGVLLERLDSEWTILKTQQILTVDDLQKLIDDCTFKNEQQRVFHSLIKYLNNCMTVQKKQMIKLRLLNEAFYRFGFDSGLAVIFDDSFKLKSAGVHLKSVLTSYGISYHNQQLNNKLQQGIFDGYNTFTFTQKNKPINQISKLYYRHLLTELNFKNQILNDPSLQYLNLFQHLLKEPIFYSILPKKKVQKRQQSKEKHFQSIMKEPILQSNVTKKYELLELRQLSMPTFKKNEKQKQSLQASFQQLKGYHIDKSRVNTNLYDNDTIQFQSLNQKQKLDILKKQLYENVGHKEKNKDEYQSRETPQRSRLIHMEPVHIKRTSITKNQLFYKESEEFKERQISNSQFNRKIKNIQGNLKKNIQITINPTQNVNSESNSRSRSRKRKIFQSHSNIKRNYSPDTQISPFKSRIKHKIFDKASPQASRSKSRTHHKIFSNNKQTNSKQIQIKETGKFYVPKTHNQLFKTKMQNQKIISKNQSQSYIKTYPITMAMPQNDKQNSVSQEKKIIKQINNTPKVSRYINVCNNDIKPDIRKQTPKKSNIIYKNDIKQSYGQYIYEPINIKKTGNKPYVADNLSLSKNNSKSNILIKDQSKKSIKETSPLKKQKMGFYMNDQPQSYKKAERLSDFKRKVNYF